MKLFITICVILVLLICSSCIVSSGQMLRSTLLVGEIKGMTKSLQVNGDTLLIRKMMKTDSLLLEKGR